MQENKVYDESLIKKLKEDFKKDSGDFAYDISLLDKANSRFKKEGVYIGDLYLDTNTNNSSSLCIILPGCPSYYNENIVKYLGIFGFDAAVIHYSGTGKSKGSIFRDPAEDVRDAVDFYKDRYEKIFIFANSYGGYVAFTLNKETIQNVYKIICISPAISLSEVIGIETLSEYVTKERADWYRFSKETFSDYIAKSTRKQISYPEKFVIFHGAKDMQINSVDVEEYARLQNIKFIEFSDEEHLSLNKFLNKKVRFLLPEIS